MVYPLGDAMIQSVGLVYFLECIRDLDVVERIKQIRACCGRRTGWKQAMAWMKMGGLYPDRNATSNWLLMAHCDLLSILHYVSCCQLLIP